MNLLTPLLDQDHLRVFAGRTAIIAANGETATYDDLLLQPRRGDAKALQQATACC
jgi:hypothetical protein